MTVRSNRLVAIVAVATVLAGCVAPTSDAGGESPVESSEEQLSRRPDMQVVPLVSDAKLRAAIAAFRARNGVEWQQVAPLLALSTNAVSGTITNMRREGPYGPNAALTRLQATERARAFFRFNADLFGLTDAQMDAAQFHAQNVATAVNDYAWVVSMYVEEHQPGYEDFDTVATRVFMTLSIGRDGSARNVRSTTSSLWPKLTLTTKPLHAATDRVVLRKVVGRDLTWIYPDPTPYDAVDDAPAPDRVGIVAKEDISFAKPIIVVEHRTHDVRLRLAWDLRVTKHGHEWTFIVDTKTGAVISQAPFFPGE